MKQHSSLPMKEGILSLQVVKKAHRRSTEQRFKVVYFGQLHFYLVKKWPRFILILASAFHVRLFPTCCDMTDQSKRGLLTTDGTHCCPVSDSRVPFWSPCAQWTVLLFFHSRALKEPLLQYITMM